MIAFGRRVAAYMDSITERHPNLGREKVWCTIDGLKLYLQGAPNQTIQERFTMDGHTTTMSHLCFAFARMEQFQLLFLMSLDQCMTVRLQSLVNI